MNNQDCVLKQFTNKRTVYLIDIIDEQSLSKFKQDMDIIVCSDEETISDNYKSLLGFDSSLAEYYKKHVKRPDITIEISSAGGSVYDGLSFYDAIRSYIEHEKYKIIGKLSGLVASMASVIALACDERIAGSHTSILVHQISTFIGKETVEGLKDELKEVERLKEVLRSIYYERTGLTKELLDEKDDAKKDWIITAKEALDYRIITKIQ